MKKPQIAAGIFLAIFLVAVLWWFGKTRADQGSPSNAVATSPAAPTKPKIRVGVYLSQYCASGADGTQWVYGHSCQMVGELRDDALKVIPIIEPGTETVGD